LQTPQCLATPADLQDLTMRTRQETAPRSWYYLCVQLLRHVPFWICVTGSRKSWLLAQRVGLPGCGLCMSHPRQRIHVSSHYDAYSNFTCGLHLKPSFFLPTLLNLFTSSSNSSVSS
jgi:hypothetical protein